MTDSLSAKTLDEVRERTEERLRQPSHDVWEDAEHRYVKHVRSDGPVDVRDDATWLIGEVDRLRADQQKMVATLQRIELATLPANHAYVPPDSIDELCRRASEALNTAFNTLRVGGSALTDQDLGAAITDPGGDDSGWRP